jgi:hypothetical protein
VLILRLLAAVWLHCTQEAALAALRLAALLCTDALHECHANPPEALCSAAIMLHDHALLVRCMAPVYCWQQAVQYRRANTTHMSALGFISSTWSWHPRADGAAWLAAASNA